MWRARRGDGEGGGARVAARRSWRRHYGCQMRGSSPLVSHILHLGTVSSGCAPVCVRVLFRTSEMREAGCGESGQLGHGSRNNEALPRRVEALAPIRASSRARNLSQCHVIDVSCGAHHSAAVTVEGLVYTLRRICSHRLPLPACLALLLCTLLLSRFLKRVHHRCWCAVRTRSVIAACMRRR